MIQKRLETMISRKPTRVDLYERYQEIVAKYNKDLVWAAADVSMRQSWCKKIMYPLLYPAIFLNKKRGFQISPKAPSILVGMRGFEPPAP